MPKKVALYNQIEKRRVEVSTDEATRLLRDPAYLVFDDSEFTVVDQWGSKFGTRGKEVYQYLNDATFRLETPREERQRFLDENYGGVGGAAAAGLLGAARGATLGISDLAANALGAGETVADLADAHPLVSTAGEVGGAIGATLLTGGAGGAVRGAEAASVLGRATGTILAKSPAALAVKGGAATAHVVEAAIRGGTTLDRGAVLLARAAGMAAEGAAFAGGAGMSEALLGDPDAAAVDILADMARGATSGAVLGGALGFAIGLPAFARRLEKATGAAETVATAEDEGLRTMLSEVTGRDLSPEAVSTWKRLTAKMQVTAGKLLRGRGSRDVDAIHEKFLVDPLRRAAATMDHAVEKSLDDVLPLWQKSRESVRSALHGEGPSKATRVARISKEAPNMSSASAQVRFASGARVFKSVLRDVQESAAAIDHKVVALKTRQFAKEVDVLEQDFIAALQKVAEPRGGEVAMQHLDRLGEAVNKRMADWKRVPQFRELPDYLQRLRAAREEMVNVLTDDQVFGAAAGKMRELRQAAGHTLKYERLLNKKFLHKTVDDALGETYELNPKRVRTLMSELGRDPDNSADLKMLADYLRSSKAQLQTNQHLLTLDPAELAAYGRASDDIDRLLGRFEAWTQAAKERADFRALSKVSGFGAFTKGAGGLLKTWAGLGFATGAATGPGSVGMWMLGSALGTLSHPAQYIQRLDQLHASRRNVGKAIESAVEGLFKVGAQARPIAVGLAAEKLGRRKKEPDIHDAIEGVGQLAAGGPATIAQLQSQYSGMRATAPLTTVAMAKAQLRGAQYLNQSAAELGLQRHPRQFRRPNAANVARWWARFHAVNDPMKHIIEPLEWGQLTHTSEEVLLNVYPPLLEAIRDRVWARLEKGSALPASTAGKLSRILGMPLDDALSPAVVSALQNAQNVLNPSTNPQVANSGRPRKTESDTLTQAQRLAYT